MRVAILTPDPDDIDRYDDWRTQADRFAELLPELTIDYPPWSADRDLRNYALVLPLMAWGYHRQPERWLAKIDAWAAAGILFANPLPVLRANTDKRYLFDLAARGVAIVPTRLTASLDAQDLAAARTAFASDELVIKPPVSAGSAHTWSITGAAPPEAFGCTMLIQPFMPMIASEGEVSLFYAGGVLAHAIIKRPAAGDFRVQPQFGGVNATIAAPLAAERLAQAALAAIGDDILYARVDMVSDGLGGFVLMELELIEPYLYLDRAADGGAAFAAAVRASIATAK